MIRIGIIARPENRGLGLQTWEASRHLDCSVLLVDVQEQRADIESHWDRYPDATRAVWRHGKFLKPRVVRRWLEQVDAVYTAETFYDVNLPNWAFAQDVATVCQLNPEFWRPSRLSSPTAWWSATQWRLEHVAPETQVVPFPVALERFSPVAPHDGPCRWLHVAGRRAIYDRNGTDALVAALPLLTEPCTVTIAVQDGDGLERLGLPALPDHVRVELQGPVADYWRLYDDQDALVMPRRYGGLCLPVQESMAAGMAVLMPACSPNAQTWPVAPTKVLGYELQHMRAGEVPVAQVDPFDIAKRMDMFADPEYRRQWQQMSRAWAATHSWAQSTRDWRARLTELHESIRL